MTVVAYVGGGWWDTESHRWTRKKKKGREVLPAADMLPAGGEHTDYTHAVPLPFWFVWTRFNFDADYMQHNAEHLPLILEMYILRKRGDAPAWISYTGKNGPTVYYLQDVRVGFEAHTSGK